MQVEPAKESKHDPQFEYVFPALRGIQAKREFYVSMCPLRLIPKLFLFDGEELVPELRAQRTLNRSRVPDIARYIVQNRRDYTFSALTVSVDAHIQFDPLGAGRDFQKMGLLRIPMSARFVVNDGQHRRAAIEMALRECPDLANESIAVVFFLDVGLERCQQMFADLNRYAIRPSTSISVLYDHRDDWAKLAKLFISRSPVFAGVVEMERSNLALRSQKLFTLSAIYHATAALMTNHTNGSMETDSRIVQAFWEEVAAQIPEWTEVRDGRVAASHVRSGFIHSHGIALQAIGRVGNALLCEPLEKWKSRLKTLATIDWSRQNASLWEGRAMNSGRIAKAGHNVVLTANAIKQKMDLPLNPDEARIEEAHRKHR